MISTGVFKSLHSVRDLKLERFTSVTDVPGILELLLIILWWIEFSESRQYITRLHYFWYRELWLILEEIHADVEAEVAEEAEEQEVEEGEEEEEGEKGRNENK